MNVSSSPTSGASRPVTGKGGPVIGFRHIGMLVLLWLFGSIALLLFRPGYGFPPFELLDSWIYTSYKWDLRNQIADFGPTYYGSRLSWILPGSLLNSFLPPVPAEICFKLLFSGLFATACGTIVYRAAGLAAALLAVTLSLFTPQIIVALHADYTDTPVIVYAALVLACIVVARDSRYWAAWILLGGCSFACMAVANLSSIGSPGLGIAVFHLLWLRWNFKRQLACVGLYLLAALAVLGVIGWIHVRLGGPFLFMKPQVGMMLYFHGLKTNPWTAANWQWLYGATWLVLPFGTLLWGMKVSVAASTGGSENRQLARALTAALFASLVWALIIQVKGVGTLLLYYYASYHLCFALPLLAVLCWQGTEPARRSVVWTGLLIVALITFSFVGKPLIGWSSLVPFHRLVRTPEFIPLLVAGLLLVLGLLGSLRVWPAAIRRGWRPEVLLMGLVACSTFTGFHGHEISDRLRERYSLVYKAYRVIAREFPQRSYNFWIHPDERNGISLASTKLWGYRALTVQPFPELGPKRFTDLTVIIPCPPGRGNEIVATAAKVLANVGVDLTAPRIIPVAGAAGLGFDLACFSMQKMAIDPNHPPAGIKPPVMLMAFLAAGDSAYTRRLGHVIHDPTKVRVLDLSPGYPVFSPSTPLDHLATQYQLCPNPGQTRHLSIVTEMPIAGNCFCGVQDQEFRHIIDLKLTKQGREVHTVSLPPESTSLRVVFECPQAASTALPTHILIYDIPE